MNRRQRRRLNRRIKADPELYGLRWCRRATLAVPVLLLAVLAVDAESSLTGLGDAVRLLALLIAVLAFALVGHSFNVRLAHRRGEWASGDPTIVIEDMADVFDVPDAMVAAPRVTQEQVQRAHLEHVIIPTAQEMADRITADLHATEKLPPGMRFVMADPDLRFTVVDKDEPS